MKNQLLKISAIIFLQFIISAMRTQSINAVAWPPYVYCVQMGYETETTNEGRFCIFPDGNRCGMEAFYEGKCGEDYVKEMECADDGESKLPGKECCPGLVPKQDVRLKNDGSCVVFEGWAVCLPCGNGVCDHSENICNCPEDCETQSLPQKINQQLNNSSKNVISTNNDIKNQFYIFGGITGALAVILVILIKKNTK
jgi:hypothetical protein